MRALLRKLLRALALRGLEAPYRRFCRPGGLEWAEMLRERGDFYSMGDHCYIEPSANITDRPYIRLGNNVRITPSCIMGHEGSINMINRAFGLRLDGVGKIDIRDNVVIGYGAIILPGVTIGPNAIVSAGSVVRSDVAEGDVVAGVPAKRVGRLDMSVEIWKAKNRAYPWRHLIEQRNSEFDPAMEPELQRLRVLHFYGAPKPSRAHREGAKSTWMARLFRRG